ncbi:Hypothetical predicted protein [Octopus vulgaris]|uniref:Coiled-coil domain-containing protein 105 n=1 Tax=Octopus vulgaris TaxID=6645 RepID=A0AA36BPA4_OCTVU|nr:Hypothetical predicted protein [Octopus vulgaris]
MDKTERVSAKMPELTIGTEEWRSRTLRGMKVSQGIMQRTEKYVAARKSTDPSPFLRDVLVRHANDAILKYCRLMREVTVKLRRALVKVNYEIVSGTRCKERLEKELDYIRKDIVTNRESQATRRFRPERELDRDGADDLLCAEMKHLVNSKKVLEVQLHIVQDGLQVLQNARKNLKATLKERGRVMELTNESVASIHFQKLWQEKPRPQTANAKLGAILPNPIELAEVKTPEVEISLREARDAMKMSCKNREEAENAIKKMRSLKDAAHLSVNKGLSKKLNETNNLLQQLSIHNGENRKSLQMANILSDKTELSKNNLMRTAYLTCRERINRPMVEVYKRHGGQDLSGAKDIRDASNILLDALVDNSRNIDLLNLAKMNIHNDLRSKAQAIHVDGDVLRLRRRNADHRWPIKNKY